MGYAKLHEEIISSSIWGESKDAKILWITMLALANKHGEVMASVPGLARAAVLDPDEVRKALDILASPDPDSRTPDDEGRRIRQIEGGWELLNYAKYRWKASTEEAKAANRERQRRFRERQKRNGVTALPNAVTERYDGVTPYNAEADSTAEAKTDAKAPSTKISSAPRSHPDESGEPAPERLWSVATPTMRNRSSKAKVAAAWRALKPKPDADEAVDGLAAWAASDDYTKEGGKYGPGLHILIRDRKWESRPEINGSSDAEHEAIFGNRASF